METIKHTPGPWTINHTSDGKAALIMLGFVASVELDQNPDGEANALLIAAAPDLLEALDNLCKQVARDCSISSDPKYFTLLERHQEAWQAIKKAKGL